MKSRMNLLQTTSDDVPPWFIKGMLCFFAFLCAIVVTVGLCGGNAKIKGLVGVKFGKKTPEQRDIGGIEGFRPSMVFVTPKSRKPILFRR